MRVLHWVVAMGLLLPSLALATDTADARHRRHKRATGLVYMPQISPAIRRARAPDLDEPPCRPCLKAPDGWYWRHHGRKRRMRRRDLIEALQQAPNASTVQVLKEAGIPIVPGVPPIVILRPKTEPDWARILRLHQ